jgi:hypothetical protein
MHVHVVSGDGKAKFWLEPGIAQKFHWQGTIITIENCLKKLNPW